MKLGLLVCGHVEESYLHIEGDYTDMFRSLFRRADPSLSWEIFDLTRGQFPDNETQVDAFISTGSSQSVYEEDPWIRQMGDLLRTFWEQKKTYVGICFGHQMMAQALGGRVVKSEKGWGVGWKEAPIHKKKDWMRPPAGGYRLLLSHQDQVLTPPPNAEILAGNSHCPHAMMQMGEHFLGIQAHPEFSPAYTEPLTQNRRELIGEPLFSEAMETFQSLTRDSGGGAALDQDRVTRWILTFIEGARR